MSEFSANDHRFMARALQLARRGLYTAHPNPRVGCVVAERGEIVGVYRAAAGQDRAALCAPALYVTACRGTGNKAALAVRHCRTAVETGCDLEARVRAAAFDARQETGIQHARGRFHEAARHLDAGVPQHIEAVAGDRVRVRHRRHHAPYPRVEQGAAARSRPALVRARLQGHVGRAATRA